MPHEFTYPSIILKPKKDIPLLGGHPWVFSGGISSVEKKSSPSDIQNVNTGSPVKVLSHDGKALGVGTYNPITNIAVRMLSRNPDEEINERFFAKKFLELDTWKRKHLPPDTNGYRLVHAEADGLPGLIIDRYADTFVFQIHTFGMEQFRAHIIGALQKNFSPKNIIERSDVEVRKIEGLKDMPTATHVGDASKPVEFMENGHTFLADVLHGQKTGFFLDQRDARTEAGKLASEKHILNLFCYTGAFSVYGAKGGAAHVTSIDISDQALAQAKENFRANNLNPDDAQKFAFENHNIFRTIEGGKKFSSLSKMPYDMIICDPPALAKSATHLTGAIKAYTTLNQFCLSHLEKGGILITSSCSGRITQEDFRNLLRLAAGRSGRIVRILKWITQPHDHGELLNFPEGRYLKTAVLEIVE
jgi:23S rRNA (cytosine1962-C5)-methyltransferase